MYIYKIPALIDPWLSSHHQKEKAWEIISTISSCAMRIERSNQPDNLIEGTGTKRWHWTFYDASSFHPKSGSHTAYIYIYIFSLLLIILNSKYNHHPLHMICQFFKFRSFFLWKNILLKKKKTQQNCKNIFR